MKNNWGYHLLARQCNWWVQKATKRTAGRRGSSTSVESIRQIHPFFAKQSQITHHKSEYRRQNTEDKNVYKCLSNKEIRSANSLGVSQDVIKNQHKNKAKQSQFPK